MKFQILRDKDENDDRMKFYRCTGRAYGWDYYGIIIEEKIYYLDKETPCGYWIIDKYGYDKRRWVSKTSRKRFAYPTREEAMNSLYYRKKRQVKILESQLYKAKKIIEKIDNDKNPNKGKEEGLW